MAAVAGPSPFANYDDYQKFKRAYKKDIQSRWSPTSGWRNMPKKPSLRRLISSSGSTINVPEDDYQEFMTFFRPAEGSKLSERYEASHRLRDAITPADYVDYAFGKNVKAPVYEQEGVGHIKKLWYTNRYQILKVEFANNGSICAFFRVPAQLAATLMSLAQSGGTRQTRYGERHLLGIYFWDLVRIRGTVHGSRYKFEYVKDGGSGGLPGRPYGSGENFYWSETGPSKTVEKTVKALQDFKDTKQALHALIAEAAKNPEVSAEEIQQYYNDLAKDADAIKAIDERIAELKSQPLVQRNRSEPRIDKSLIPPEIDYEAAERAIDGWEETTPLPKTLSGVVQLQAYPSLYAPERQGAVQPLSRDQYNEIVSHQQKADNQEKAISRRNAARRIDRIWDVDKIDNLVDSLDTKGLLGRSVDSFYNKFPHASQQFDYLKARGLIPPNAIFK